MSVYVWPTRWFPGDVPSPRPVGRALNGPQSTSGQQQIGRTDGGGLWRVQIKNIFLTTPDQLQAWDAWFALLDEGATAVIVGKSMGARAPALAGVAVPEQAIASPFPVAVSAYGPTGSINATIHGAVAVRATQLTIRIGTGCRAIKGGEHFAVNHTTKGWRRYTVAEVVSVSGSDYLCNIRTPFREATTGDVNIDFNGPACVMRVETMTDPERIRGGKVEISFVETFGT